MYYMDVLSIRVRKGLKKELEELGIDYPKLVREFLEEVVKREKRKRLLKEAETLRKRLAERTLAPSAELVREDREETSR